MLCKNNLISNSVEFSSSYSESSSSTKTAETEATVSSSTAATSTSAASNGNGSTSIVARSKSANSATAVLCSMVKGFVQKPAERALSIQIPTQSSTSQTQSKNVESCQAEQKVSSSENLLTVRRLIKKAHKKRTFRQDLQLAGNIIRENDLQVNVHHVEKQLQIAFAFQMTLNRQNRRKIQQ
ncbi:hypothetical protein TRFO_31358 [Tritrichomonas foetus]|uniref:Uncharacterized protein n=1 Tax=Tritrichomonas foetus TaxID=1144522 RepID=A0A1J4JSH0_9EUKA|nr:hypothetical protein TRFO_31358 [Tritrichomonas foetus]|eukprot:OHT01706.1 hypothetical protein TRFO_31358 [Tritrichomonas foetus]